MAVHKAATKAEPALAAGLVLLSSAVLPATKLSVSISLKTSLIILTGRFQLIALKCCFYATIFSHNCRNALVAFAFLRYNIGLKGEIMIKPGTVCMIRGVPAKSTGSDCNGKIVVVEGQTVIADFVLYTFTPALQTAVPVTGVVYTSREQYLYPLDSCEDDLAREQLDEVLEATFLQTLETELSKI